MKIKNLIASFTFIGIIMAGVAFAVPSQAVESTQTVEALTPKQIEQFTDMHEDHVKKTRSLRSDLQAKRMEFRALRNNAKVTPGYISDLTEEIVELQNDIEDMNEDFFKAAEKKFGLDFSSMRGAHRGMGMRNGMSCPRAYGSQSYHSQHGYGNLGGV